MTLAVALDAQGVLHRFLRKADRPLRMWLLGLGPVLSQQVHTFRRLGSTSRELYRLFQRHEYEALCTVCVNSDGTQSHMIIRGKWMGNADL
jgi:hypothetical protein